MSLHTRIYTQLLFVLLLLFAVTSCTDGGTDSQNETGDSDTTADSSGDGSDGSDATDDSDTTGDSDATNDSDTTDDVNECETGENDCAAVGGTCTNTDGGYNCGCESGYLFDDTTFACTPWTICGDNEFVANKPDASTDRACAPCPTDYVSTGPNATKCYSTLPFISKWTVDKEGYGNDRIHLPLVENGTYDFTVNWGDGSEDTITAWDDAATTHTYAAAGTYTVTITGTIHGWQFFKNTALFDSPATENAVETPLRYAQITDEKKLIEISQWGSLFFGDTVAQFYGAENLEITATDLPYLDETTSLAAAFAGVQTDIPVADLDVSTIEDFQFAFFMTPEFNADISGWDMSNATNTRYMFSRADVFDQPIGDWNTSNITDMSHMFYLASSFSHDVGGWDTANVTDMSGLFNYMDCYNADISNWDTSKVEDMSYMFYSASCFDADISGWDTSNVKDMSGMFYGANAMDADITGWNTSSVENMSNMFTNHFTFNQDISEWDVSKVTNMSKMFENAESFNQNLSDWDVSNVMYMEAVFRYAESFNGDLSGWDTSSVVRSDSMFLWAKAFDQDLSNWDMGKNMRMSEMFDYTALSTANYDALLISLAEQTLQSNVTLGASETQYSAGAAATARQSLIDNNGWTIKDYGEAP